MMIIREVRGRSTAHVLTTAIAWIAAGIGHAQGADDPGADRPASLQEAAAGYRLAAGEDRAIPLIWRPEPALRWTNPVRETGDGAVFLWLADGRPEVVASFYRFRRNGGLVEDHEFMSLATGPLAARKDGRVIWSPSRPGVEFRPIPGAPRVAGLAAERARQMRALAREFKAFFDTGTDHTELRLLTQPLYRYEGERPDGALFAFVQATDPEVLLLIEARPDGTRQSWHYALARMSIVNLRAQHKDADVWRVGWATNPEVADPNQPYFVNRDVAGTGR